MVALALSGIQPKEDAQRCILEDRYHATAVESGDHLLQCLVYIDLNMVRAGVVKHPSGWAFSGYNEIQKPRQRYALIDDARLMNLVGIEPYDLLKDSHRRWVDASVVSSGDNTRVSDWTQSITACPVKCCT
jgi:hypothetical protein